MHRPRKLVTFVLLLMLVDWATFLSVADRIWDEADELELPQASPRLRVPQGIFPALPVG